MENIESKFKHLNIGDRKRWKFNDNYDAFQDKNSSLSLNPFNKQKCLKNKYKQNSKLMDKKCSSFIMKNHINDDKLSIDFFSFNRNSDDSNDNNQNNNDNIRIMNDLNDKMINLWTKNGYRTNTKTKANYLQKDHLRMKNENNTAIKPNEMDEQNSNSLINQQQQQQTCAQQATLYDNCDTSLVIELAAYLDETLFIPKKMSFMAEMMYT